MAADISDTELFYQLRKSFPHGCMERETSWTGAQFVASLVGLYWPVARGPYNIVEVGCMNGVTAAHIVNTIKNQNRPAGPQVDTGFYRGYELDSSFAELARERLWTVYPLGPWEIIEGDFFETYNPDQPVDFAFIDPDPKTIYVDAYMKLNMNNSSVVVAHDSVCDQENVRKLIPLLQQDGFIVHEFNVERGFIVGVRTW